MAKKDGKVGDWSKNSSEDISFREKRGILRGDAPETYKVSKKK